MGRGQANKPTLPLGTQEVLLSLGRVVGRIFLSGATPEFLEAFRLRYDPWCLPSSDVVKETFVLRVALTPLPSISGEAMVRQRIKQTADHPLAVHESDEVVQYSRWDLSARLQRASAHESPWHGTATCECGVLSFDALIRILWSILLPRAGGALIHACAVRVGQSALLLPGQSGAGKSTFAGKMPDAADVLTDEMAPLVPDGGGFRVCSSPFWGDFKRGGGSLRSWPLRAIVHLEKGAAFKLQAVSSAETLGRLLGCFLYFGVQDESARRNFGVAAALATAVPARVATTNITTPPANLVAALANEIGGFDEPDDHVNSRELISDWRWTLQKHGHHAYMARGGSMHPSIRSGTAIFVESVDTSTLVPGNVLLYWVPGPQADDDRLICHRLVLRQKTDDGVERFATKGDTAGHIEQFDNGKEAEVLGKVTTREPKPESRGVVRALPAQTRARELGRLLVSLGTGPLSKLVGR